MCDSIRRINRSLGRPDEWRTVPGSVATIPAARGQTVSHTPTVTMSATNAGWAVFVDHIDHGAVREKLVLDDGHTDGDP